MRGTPVGALYERAYFVDSRKKRAVIETVNELKMSRGSGSPPL
jgi:hypothetical protein